MKRNFISRIFLTVAVFSMIEEERASAMEIRFSGVIAEAVTGNYGVAVGNTFSGNLIYDLEVFPSSGGFGGAIIDIQTATPSPAIVFYHPNCTLTMGDGSMYLVGNPFDFFGWLSLSMDSSGSVTGGELYLNSEPLKNNGAFRGVVNVPEGSATIVLFVLGLLSLAWFRRTSRIG